VKEFYRGPLGNTGGELVVKSEERKLKVEVSHPIDPLLVLIKTNFVDKLKKIIPGNWDDVLIDEAWERAVSEVVD